MRNKLLIRIFIVILITSIPVLSMGCGTMSKGQREKRLKELLREKYGEEFEVRELYDTGAIEAWCYPQNDPTMIFKVETMLEMKEIAEDDYLQSLVGRQLSKEYQLLAENAFGECFVYSKLLLASTPNYPSPNSKTITLEELLDYIHSNNFGDSVHLYVFVNKNKNNNVIMDELEFVRIIGNKIAEGELPTSTKVFIMFGDENFLLNVEKSLNEFGWHTFGGKSRTDIMDVIGDKDEIRIYYDSNGNPLCEKGNTDEVTIMDKEEYESLRMEVIE